MAESKEPGKNGEKKKTEAWEQDVGWEKDKEGFFEDLPKLEPAEIDPDAELPPANENRQLPRSGDLQSVKLVVTGASGRMGRRVLAHALAGERFDLKAAIVRENSPFAGGDAGQLISQPETGIPVTTDLASSLEGAEVLVDFTHPDRAVHHARMAAKAGVALMLGTTGLSEDQQAGLCKFAGKIPVLQAGALSLGATVMLALAEKMASLLGEDYDAEILEWNHRGKIDAPSALALELGEAVAKGRDVDFTQEAEGINYGRMAPRAPGKIGFAVLRGGDGPGRHELILTGSGETLRLKHEAHDLDLYARAALRACLWLRQASPGLYSMRDVLGIADL